MTVLTIEIPDSETEEVVKYLKGKNVVMKKAPDKSLDDLIIDDYRKDTFMRTKNRPASAIKYL